MQKFNNYVFMAICELNFKLFKISTFSNFLAFHNQHKLIFKDLTSKRLITTSDFDKINKLFNQIINELDLIFNIGHEEACMFILEYYDLDDDKINEMYKSINLFDTFINFKGC